MSEQAPEPRGGILLWDLPVRIVHWSFVLLLGAMWWTVENDEVTLHKQLGVVFLGLLAFRILWGFFGSSTARFAQFLKGPGAVIAYLRGKGGDAPHVGHNPVGGWSTLLLLGLLAVQMGFGLVAQDVDGIESGPLNHLVSYDAADAAREWHELGFNIILGLVIIHVIAILFYLVAKRNNLIAPMLSGRRDLGEGVAQPRIGGLLAFAICASIAAGFAWWIWIGAPPSGQ